MALQSEKTNSGLASRLYRWFRYDFLGIIKDFRLSYLPPLMVYFAYGVSGFTIVIESFFIKDQLGLSAAFIAGLGFWVGLPWAFKMPMGHLVDLFWRRKAWFVYLGACLMSASLLIMVGLTGYKEWMAGIMDIGTWYIVSAILAPLGFVMQDVVADAMTVEAVPTKDKNGRVFPEAEIKRMHVTMQTLGRVALVGGSAVVAGLGGWLAQAWSYRAMYTIALFIPVISVTGVFLHAILQRLEKKKGLGEPVKNNASLVKPNWYILGGSALFVVVTLGVGLTDWALKSELVFSLSMGIVGFLLWQLLKILDVKKRREILGIAIIIFVFRAMPTAGAGSTWWQIDELGFDEAFFGTLRQVAAILAIVGMFALRGWMARKPIPYLVVFLSLLTAGLTLPYIGIYYGLADWTMETFGFGARTIAIVDTLADSPFGQVAMVPMLAWIARETPRAMKATYFAVMSAFTNLALSLSQLLTQYLNKIFVVERGDYSELGLLLITGTLFALVVPVIAVFIFNPFKKKKSV